MDEVRCPTCAKLVAVKSSDFAGDLSLFCGRCKANFGSSTPDLPSLDCRCGRRLHMGVVIHGRLRTTCRSCRVLVAITASGASWLETPYDQARHAQRRQPIKPEQIVALVEERWALLGRNKAWQRVEIAVGLRFDVFNRDGFRCRYCGRGVDNGALLEADHVLPRSAGGLDSMANLVTACEACNRGKSAKRLLTEAAS